MAATNDFVGRLPPRYYSQAAAVTPSDTVDLTNVTLAIYVGGAGAIKVDMLDGGTAITFAAVPVGTILMVRAKRIYSTNTTATNLVALW